MLKEIKINHIYNQDCLEGLKQLPDCCVDVAVTSPPYWGQRGDAGIGSEEDPREYVNNLTEILLEVLRVLKPPGVLWLNLGDAYNTPINWKFDDKQYSTLGPNGNGLSPTNTAYTKERGNRRAFIQREIGWLKYGNLLALPWRIITKLCDNGNYYRGEVIWAKKKVMPEGICRRPHRRHESIFIITKNERHYFRVKPPVPSVWELKPDPSFSKGHTSTFPLSLPITCIESTGIEGGIVLDPFMGSGSTAVAAISKGFEYVGFELSSENIKLAQTRISRAVYQPDLLSEF